MSRIAAIVYEDYPYNTKPRIPLEQLDATDLADIRDSYLSAAQAIVDLGVELVAPVDRDVDLQGAELRRIFGALWDLLREAQAMKRLAQEVEREAATKPAPSSNDATTDQQEALAREARKARHPSVTAAETPEPATEDDDKDEDEQPSFGTHGIFALREDVTASDISRHIDSQLGALVASMEGMDLAHGEDAFTIDRMSDYFYMTRGMVEDLKELFGRYQAMAQDQPDA